MGVIEYVRPADVLKLLAEAVWRLDEDAYAQGLIRRAKELVPNLESHFTPPCPGQFGFTSCCEYHQHGLDCGNPEDVCTLCQRTNQEHRDAWSALE